MYISVSNARRAELMVDYKKIDFNIRFKLFNEPEVAFGIASLDPADLDNGVSSNGKILL